MLIENVPENTGAIVILVHGTFTNDAAWTRKKSRLRETVLDYFSGKVSFYRFRWSGYNTHRARLKAGDKLRRFLERLAAGNKSSKIILIAHSHGGNVLSYALHKTSVAPERMLCVSFATPFIEFVPRSFNLSLDFLMGMIGFGVPLIGVFLLVIFMPFVVDTFPEISAVIFTIGIIGFCVCVYMYGISKGAGMRSEKIDRFFAQCREGFRRNLENTQHETLTRLSLCKTISTPLLSLQVVADEARNALSVASSLGNIPFTMFNIFYKLALLDVFGLTLAAIIMRLFESFHPDTKYVDDFGPLVRIAFGLPFVCLLAMIILQLLMPISSIVRALGYGSLGWLPELMIDMRVRKAPKEWDNVDQPVVYFAVTPHFFSLRHSKIYEDDNFMKAMCNWFKCVDWK